MLPALPPRLAARRDAAPSQSAACLERQAARLGDLVVVPIPHLAKLESQLLILLLEMGNFARRLELGRLGGTLPVRKRGL